MRLADGVYERATARIGGRFADRFALEAIVGVGGTATVYRARGECGSLFALKVLHPELHEDATVRERFLREGYAANVVAHPRAVRVLAHGTDVEGAPWLALELLEGISLEDHWRIERVLSVPRVLAIGAQILEVLGAAHAKEIVHRDVKPANVFLEQGDRVRLLDFGLARLVSSPRMTPTGDTLGTAEFAAPEQARGAAKNVDARADVYSVGALMFSLLSGRFVHDAPNPMERMVLAATRPAPSIATVAKGTPKPLADLVTKALSFRRDERFTDANTMLNALTDVSRFLASATESDNRGA